MTETNRPLVLVANRGEIARRIIKGAHAVGLRALAVYEATDSALPYVQEADVAAKLGESVARTPYLDGELLLRIAQEHGATAVHPGYGFLSENAGFAEAVVSAGLVWVGPSPEAIAAMGDKVQAKELMAKAMVPLLPGSNGPVLTEEQACEVTDRIGFPVMIKASAGGGGMGMVVARDQDELRREFVQVQKRAERLFGDGSMLVERYVESARHIEIQLFGESDGRLVALGERDCSVQRRHQKIIEESPSPFVDGKMRRALNDVAVRAGEAIAYRNAGTVEFVVDAETGEYYFLEMNTRLQVEHPVTELVADVDLVAAQFETALDLPRSVRLETLEEPHCHAIELRVCAEDPETFMPSPGVITGWREPEGPGVRVDSGYTAGTEISRLYDPLIAKVIVHADDRPAAISRARQAVADFVIEGPKTNLAFLARVLESAEFGSGIYDTSLAAELVRVASTKGSVG